MNIFKSAIKLATPPGLPITSTLFDQTHMPGLPDVSVHGYQLAWKTGHPGGSEIAWLILDRSVTSAVPDVSGSCSLLLGLVLVAVAVRRRRA